jgi:hypothetical protein
MVELAFFVRFGTHDPRSSAAASQSILIGESALFKGISLVVVPAPRTALIMIGLQNDSSELSLSAEVGATGCVSVCTLYSDSPYMYDIHIHCTRRTCSVPNL